MESSTALSERLISARTCSRCDAMPCSLDAESSMPRARSLHAAACNGSRKAVSLASRCICLMLRFTLTLTNPMHQHHDQHHTLKPRQPCPRRECERNVRREDVSSARSSCTTRATVYLHRYCVCLERALHLEHESHLERAFDSQNVLALRESGNW